MLASLPALCRRHCQHCIVVVAGIAPASSPSLHGRLYPHCAGIVALVAFVLPPALQAGIYPVTKQLRHALASLPASHRHCCRRCASIVALVAQASSPLSGWCCCPCHIRIAASQTGTCPVMMQLQHVAGEGSLLCSSSFPVASLLYPASAHSSLAFNGRAKAAMACFFGAALASLPALHWRHCQP